MLFLWKRILFTRGYTIKQIVCGIISSRMIVWSFKGAGKVFCTIATGHNVLYQICDGSWTSSDGFVTFEKWIRLSLVRFLCFDAKDAVNLRFWVFFSSSLYYISQCKICDYKKQSVMIPKKSFWVKNCSCHMLRKVWCKHPLS